MVLYGCSLLRNRSVRWKFHFHKMSLHFSMSTIRNYLQRIKQGQLSCYPFIYYGTVNALANLTRFIYCLNGNSSSPNTLPANNQLLGIIVIKNKFAVSMQVEHKPDFNQTYVELYERLSFSGEVIFIYMTNFNLL